MTEQMKRIVDELKTKFNEIRPADLCSLRRSLCLLPRESFQSRLSKFGAGGLTVVVGATDCEGRRSRGEYAKDDSRMLSASSGDGLAAGRLVTYWASKRGLNSDHVQWTIDQTSEIPRLLANRDVLVIGSPAVNLVAYVLNGLELVTKLRFQGRDSLPARLGDELCVGDSNLEKRGPGGHGMIVMIRNPWSMDHNLLWIAGLMAADTRQGGEICEKLCERYRAEAQIATGLVFSVSGSAARPKKWLVQPEDEPTWLDVGELSMERILSLEKCTWKLYPKMALGGGGFGKVYLGAGNLETEHERLDYVAIKKLTRDQEREVAIVGKRLAGNADLQHVLPYYDVGTHDNHAYVVMALADRTLNDEIAEGAKNPEEAARILADVVQGLVELHDCGIVHRDVKPGNILRHKGRWKLADFGISRDSHESTDAHTLKGCGTPAYWAPEAFEGKPSMPSDIYSAGCVGYFLLTGRPPFDPSDATTFDMEAPAREFLGAANPVDKLRQLHREHAPPEIENVPMKLGELLREMLHKDPRQRPTAEHVAAILREQFGPDSAPSQPAPAPLEGNA